jgi:hypothetical protein
MSSEEPSLHGIGAGGLLGTVANVVASVSVSGFCWNERVCFDVTDHSACPDDVGLVLAV